MIANAERLADFLNDLSAVSFTYRNGTTVTFTGDALSNWIVAYRGLLAVQTTLLKSFAENPPTSAPTTQSANLADELKKRS